MNELTLEQKINILWELLEVRECGKWDNYYCNARIVDDFGFDKFYYSYELERLKDQKMDRRDV